MLFAPRLSVVVRYVSIAGIIVYALCTGSPAWSALGDANEDLVYTPLAPCRLLDTRGNGAPLQGGSFPPGSRRTMTPAGACGIPQTGVVALQLTFHTGVITSFPNQTRPGGYISMVKPGAPITTLVGVIDYGLGLDDGVAWAAGGAAVPTNDGGEFDVYVLQAPPTLLNADVIIDVMGYFKSALNASTGAFEVAVGDNLALQIKPNGAFLFADSSNFDFNSAAPNEFAARATGGARFVTGIDGTGQPTTGVAIAAGGGSWSSLSDRNAKVGFEAIDPKWILSEVARMPITRWSYKSQGTSVRHIGPVAQDFKTAFGVGENDTTITTVDADGVALAAIQGLHQLVQEKDREITQQQKDLQRLSILVKSLAAKIELLERRQQER